MDRTSVSGMGSEPGVLSLNLARLKLDPDRLSLSTERFTVSATQLFLRLAKAEMSADFASFFWGKEMWQDSEDATNRGLPNWPTGAVTRSGAASVRR